MERVIPPIDGEAYLTQGYGLTPFARSERGKRAYKNFQGGIHPGLDFGTHGRNSPVRSATDGKVVAAGPRGGWGNMVEVRGKDGWRRQYAHLDRVCARDGAAVRKGDVIGTVGNTGASTGIHLHYGNRRWTTRWEYRDPTNDLVDMAKKKPLLRSCVLLSGLSSKLKSVASEAYSGFEDWFEEHAFDVRTSIYNDSGKYAVADWRDGKTYRVADPGVQAQGMRDCSDAFGGERYDICVLFFDNAKLEGGRAQYPITLRGLWDGACLVQIPLAEGAQPRAVEEYVRHEAMHSLYHLVCQRSGGLAGCGDQDRTHSKSAFDARPEARFESLFSGMDFKWFEQDKETNDKDMKLGKQRGTPHVYLVNEEKREKAMVVDMETLGNLKSMSTGYEEVEGDFSEYETTGTLVWVDREIK